jgi:hypothetical protein
MKLLRYMTIVAALLTGPAAYAAIVVQFRGTLPGSAFSTITNQPFVTIGGDNSVTIANPNVGTFRIYSTNPGVESIGQVRFTGGTGGSNIGTGCRE